MDGTLALLLLIISTAPILHADVSEQTQEHPNFSLEHADVPFYPPIARAARIGGTVEVTVTVQDGKVSDAKATTGPKILATAATENVKSWRFHSWVNGSFSTKFIYRIETNKQLLADPRIELDLPIQVVITTVPPVLDTDGKSHSVK